MLNRSSETVPRLLSSCESVGWLLSFDFDGTLLMPDATPPVSPGLFSLLSQRRQPERLVWGINTGRSLPFLLEGLVAADFPLLPDYIIAREREIYLPGSPQGESVCWQPHLPWNEKSDLALDRLFSKHGEFLRRTRAWVENDTGAVWGFQDGEPAGIVASTVQEMDGIVQALDREVPGLEQLSYQRNGIYLRLSHADFHKGSAMAEVARLHGVDSSRTFAVGDSYNDLDMLDPEWADHLACPSNACDEVKREVLRHGGYVASGEASHGVEAALRDLFDRYGGGEMRH